jgi:hypothetical protein
VNFRSFIYGCAVTLALPQAALACAQLSEHIWMCDRDTPWESADWDPAGDGSTRIMGDLTLNFTEEWPGFEIGDDLATLEERYATYAEWVNGDGNAPLEVFQVDKITLTGGSAVRSIQRDALEGLEFTSAVMLAEFGSSRIMLYLDAPTTTKLAEMDVLSREVASMLRDTCADQISCADDYQRPSAAEERG